MNLIHFVSSSTFDAPKALSLLEQIKCSTPEEILALMAVKMKLRKELLIPKEMDLFQELFGKVTNETQVGLEQILLSVKMVDFWRFTLQTKPFPPCLQTLVAQSKNVCNVRHCRPLFGPFLTAVPFYHHSQNVVPSMKCTENCVCKQSQLLIPFDQYCEEKQIASLDILVLNTQYNDQVLCGSTVMIPRIQCIVLTEPIEIKNRLLFSVTQDQIVPGLHNTNYYLSVQPSFLDRLPKIIKS